MMNRRSVLMTAAASVASGCVPRSSLSAPLEKTDSLKLVSAANPHVFPLMLAVALEPDLPLSFTPIKESAEIDAMFRNGEADAFQIGRASCRERVCQYV